MPSVNLSYKDIFESIVNSNRDIKLFYTTEFSSNNNVQSLNLSQKEKAQVAKALEIRETYKFSFWEALMSTYSHTSDFSFLFLREAMYHNQITNFKEFFANDIDRIIEYFEENETKNIALQSKVLLTNGEERHIPMIDFHIPVSASNKNVVLNLIKILDPPGGYIIKSGKSYHYMGVNLMSENDLINFLGKLLLFSPIVDRNWISHQILERICALRITAGDKNKTVILNKSFL